MANKSKRGRPSYFGERMTYIMRTPLDRTRMDLYDAAAASRGVSVAEWTRSVLDVAAERTAGAPAQQSKPKRQLPLAKTGRRAPTTKRMVGPDGMNAQERKRQKKLPGISLSEAKSRAARAAKSDKANERKGDKSFAERMREARAAKKIMAIAKKTN